MDWNLLRRSAAIALALMALCAADARAQALKITFLGTGAPMPAMNRFGPSILIEAGGQKILFDAGRGALQPDPGQRALAGRGWRVPDPSAFRPCGGLPGSLADRLARQSGTRSRR